MKHGWLVCVVLGALGCDLTEEVGEAAAELGGTPEVLVDGLGYPIGLGQDAQSLYWIDLDAGVVQRAPKSGGDPVTLVEGVAPCTVWAVAEDAANLYWADCGEGDVMRIRRLSKYGGAPVTIATRPQHFSVLAVDSLYVYWSEVDDVVRAPKYGGAAAVVATAPDDDRTISGIAVDDAAIYYAESFSAAGLAPGTVWRTPRGGGPRVALVTDARPSGLTAARRCRWQWWRFACRTDLYWAEVGAGEIRRVAGLGGAVETVASEPTAALLADLELDGDALYWSASGSFVEPGGVFRTQLDGGAVETLVRFAAITGIELDAGYVYVASQDAEHGADGAILRVAR